MADRSVIVVVTAHDCSACTRIMGNKLIGNGSPYMSYETVKAIISPKNSQKHNIFYIIELAQRSPNLGLTIAISRIELLKNGNLKQEKRYVNNGTGIKSGIVTCSPKNKMTIIKDSVVKGDEKWQDYVKRKIPQNLERYMQHYYPAFIAFNIKQWIQSLVDPAIQLIGYSNYLLPERNTLGEVHMGSPRNPNNKKEIDFIELAKLAVEGKLDYSRAPNESHTNESHTNESHTNSNYILVDYFDDE